MSFISKDREPIFSELANVAARLAVVESSFKALEDNLPVQDRIGEVAAPDTHSNQPEVTYIPEAQTQPNNMADMASHRARHEARSAQELLAEIDNDGQEALREAA